MVIIIIKMIIVYKKNLKIRNQNCDGLNRIIMFTINYIVQIGQHQEIQLLMYDSFSQDHALYRHILREVFQTP